MLESLAYNIVARIDDLLYIDDLTKHSEQFSSLLRAGLIGPKSVSSTPYRTTFTTPNFSPAQLASLAKGDRSSFFASNKVAHRSTGAKKVLTDYLSIDLSTEGSCSSTYQETSVSFEHRNEELGPEKEQ